MKKIYFVLALMLSFGLFSKALAIELPWIKKNQTTEIKTFLKKHDKAMQSHNVENLKEFYSDDYKNGDGFNLEVLTSMLEKTYSAYGNIKYKTKINNITTFDNWALVQMSDKSCAKVYPDKNKKNKEKMGVLEGVSSYIVYLKNTDEGWKIVSDEILMEETTLKYGIANKINMDLVTPVFVQNGQEYDLSLKMDKPEDIIALASITREEVAYPPSDTKEKFRKFPADGELERLVRANNKNLDEYAIASIGFTKISFNEQESKARIEVLGMAYLMKRINNDSLALSKKKFLENK